MPAFALPAALLAHTDRAHAAASDSDVASLVLAALPFLVVAGLLSRSRNGAAGVVLFSAAAGFVHAVVTPEHFSEDFAVGLFTLAVAVGQMAVVVAGLNRPSRALWASAAAGNTVVLAIWALSRTTGLPVGPAPGAPESGRPARSRQCRLRDRRRRRFSGPRRHERARPAVPPQGLGQPRRRPGESLGHVQPQR